MTRCGEMWYDMILTSRILHLALRLRLASGALRGLLPLLLYSGDAAVLKAEEWYCGMHTGVTYIVAVLLAHILTTVLSSRLFHRRARGQLPCGSPALIYEQEHDDDQHQHGAVRGGINAR